MSCFTKTSISSIEMARLKSSLLLSDKVFSMSNIFFAKLRLISIRAALMKNFSCFSIFLYICSRKFKQNILRNRQL